KLPRSPHGDLGTRLVRDLGAAGGGAADLQGGEVEGRGLAAAARRGQELAGGGAARGGAEVLDAAFATLDELVFLVVDEALDGDALGPGDLLLVAVDQGEGEALLGVEAVEVDQLA